MFTCFSTVVILSFTLFLLELYLYVDIHVFLVDLQCCCRDVYSDELPPIAAASMWTRKDVKEFKDSLKNDHESVLKVGSGEIVTVSHWKSCSREE